MTKMEERILELDAYMKEGMSLQRLLRWIETRRMADVFDQSETFTDNDDKNYYEAGASVALIRALINHNDGNDEVISTLKGIQLEIQANLNKISSEGNDVK